MGMYMYTQEPMKETRGKEHTTPTQLIKIAKARHLAGVTIFRCSTWPRPPHV